jgi:hypothetical protein
MTVGATNRYTLKNTGITLSGTNSSELSINSIRSLIGYFGATLFPIVFFFVVIGGAKPDTIEIGSGENITVDIGLINQTGEFESDIDNLLPPYVNSCFINFEVVQYPGNNSDGSWYVTFNPKSIQPERGVNKSVKTQMKVSFIAPSNPKDTIQSGILKIRIKNIQVMGNLWNARAPKGVTIPKSLQFYYNSLFGRAIWWIFARINKWGTWSGTVDTSSEVIVDIPVKVKPYHNIRFETLPLIQFNPGQITSIPISVQNLGNYNDTYGFRITGNFSNNVVSDPLSISLRPGETSDTQLGVAVMPNILDTGTIRSVTIEAYSIDQPNVTIAQRTILLETQGVYISELGGAGVLLFGILVIVSGVLVLYRRRKIVSKMYKKPEKPWDVPEKKQELKTLRKENPEKYETTLRDMENEYKSSISAYKSDRMNFLKESRKQSFKRFTDTFKRPERQKREKPKKMEKKQRTSDLSRPRETKKLGFTLKAPSKKRQKETGADRTAETEKKQKERAIRNIIKEQEKQREKNE